MQRLEIRLVQNMMEDDCGLDCEMSGSNYS